MGRLKNPGRNGNEKKRKVKKVKKEKLKLLNELRRKIEELSDSSTDSSSSSETYSETESEVELEPSLQGNNNQGLNSRCPEESLAIGDGNNPPVNNQGEALSILGANPSCAEVWGPKIHEEVALRWSAFLKQGIDKNEKKPIMDKYPISENCKALVGPQVNTEIKTCLGETVLRQDSFLARLQQELGVGITAMAQPLNIFFSAPSDTTNPLLLNLVEAAKILTNVHHSISMHRRYLLLPHLNPLLRKALEELPIQENLFGQDLAEKLKKCSELKRTSLELKINKPSSSKTTYPLATKNYKRPLKSRKMKKEERGSRNTFNTHKMRREGKPHYQYRRS